MSRRVDPFERRAIEPSDPGRSRAGTDGVGTRSTSPIALLDGLVRPSAALAMTSFVGLPLTVYGVLVVASISDACEQAGGVDCVQVANRRFVALVVVLGLLACIAVLALAGAIRGLVAGWPGDRRPHRARLGLAILLSLPMNGVTAVGVGAWFVDWYRH